jgi:hypothetical protein
MQLRIESEMNQQDNEGRYIQTNLTYNLHFVLLEDLNEDCCVPDMYKALAKQELRTKWRDILKYVHV